MPYQRYQGYQYETSPRKLQPEYTPKKSQYPKKKSYAKNGAKDKKKVKRALKPKAKLVLYIAIGFMVLFGMCYQNSLITENFNEKEEKKKNLSAIEKENEQLKVNIEKSLNLNNVEQSAKELLGMQKLDNTQKIYISLPKKDYIESSAEEVIIKEETSLWQKILNAINKFIK